MTNTANSRQAVHTVWWSIPLVILIAASCGPITAGQDTPSQRRVPTAQGLVNPLDQLRLLMQMQRGVQPPIPDAEQLKNNFNLTDDQINLLRDALIRSGLIPDKLPAQSDRGRSPGFTPSKPRNRREQLLQELSGDLPDTGAGPSNPASSNDFPWQPNLRPTPTSPNSDGVDPQSARRQPTNPTFTPRRFPSRAQSQRPQSVPALPTESSGFAADINRQSREAQRRLARLAERQAAAQSADRSTAGSDAGPSFDIAQELSNRGLEKTFRRLVRDIQSKVQQQNRDASAVGTSSEESSWNQAFVKVLDAVREDVVETVREARNKQAKQRAQSSQQAAAQSGNRTESPSSNESSPESGGPSDTISGAAQTTPSAETDTFPSWSSNGSVSTSTQVAIILTGLAIACGFFLWTARRQQLARASASRRETKPVRPQDIKAPEDIIRAFHWLTLGRSPDAAEWWNHLQAQESLSQNSQVNAESLQQLARLYEEARYKSNRDTPLDTAQLHQARSALTGCLS